MSNLIQHLSTNPPKSPCSIAQAMSALVKCIRLRKFDQSIYWAGHVFFCFPNDRYRLLRRMVIIAAEDNNHLGIQEKMVQFLGKQSKKAQIDNCFPAIAALIYLIHNRPNWWQDPDGQLFIGHWALTDTVPTIDTSLEDLMEIVNEAALANILLREGEQDFTHADVMVTVMRHYNGYLGTAAKNDQQKGAKLALANALYTHCTGSSHPYVNAGQIPASVHGSNAAALSGDENYLGQALYRACAMPLGDQHEDAMEIDGETINETVEAQLTLLANTPEKPPAWSQDGIHCKGDDKRFAGMLSSMLACINVFNKDQALELNEESEFEAADYTNHQWVKNAKVPA